MWLVSSMIISIIKFPRLLYTHAAVLHRCVLESGVDNHRPRAGNSPCCHLKNTAAMPWQVFFSGTGATVNADDHAIFGIPLTPFLYFFV